MIDSYENMCIYDMHTHSEHSHDSVCKLSDMAHSAKNHGLCGFAVTDHCDIEYCDTVDVFEIAKNSATGARALGAICGIEIGEGFWHGDITEKIIKQNNFDVIIGSVHAVRYKNYTMPYSQIDFSKMPREEIGIYVSQYFHDMKKMITKCDFDILAHLTCPLRYISGKYKILVPLDAYSKQIDEILKLIIEKNIALEVNTSNVFPNSAYCEFMPCESIVRRYKELGGYLITLGSDAHIAENCANSFESAYKMLCEVGFENVYYYKNRTAVPCGRKAETI